MVIVRDPFHLNSYKIESTSENKDKRESTVTEKDEAKKAHSVAPRNNGIELGPVSAKQFHPLHDFVMTSTS